MVKSEVAVVVLGADTAPVVGVGNEVGGEFITTSSDPTEVQPETVLVTVKL